MITKTGVAGVVALLLGLAACGSDADRAPSASTSTPATQSTPSPTSIPSPNTTEATGFPVSAFADISEEPVTEELATRLQAALATHDVSSGGGMSATVMTVDGTWSGTTGKADGVRDLWVDDQFAIASIVKSMVAAQVMLMVEAGELNLEDRVADHLPRGLELDTNEATIRQLLSHRSGLPDYYDLLYGSQQRDFQRVWTPTEILELLPPERTPAGTDFLYTETNYLLLELAIEHIRGLPYSEVMRDGALAVEGLERLVHQPAERPTQPIAMPAGESRSVLKTRGGYIPSLASVTAYPAIASDSRSLARWWTALCAGDVVTRASLNQMSAMEPAPYVGSYGLGVTNPASGYASGIGHGGQVPGYMSWAACLPEDEAVIVVLTNHEIEDGHLAYSRALADPLIEALRSS